MANQALFITFNSDLVHMPMPLTLDTRVQLLPNQSSSVLGNETILLNYEAGNYYELNEVGGFIWALLQDKKSLLVHEIQTQLLEEFDVEPLFARTS